MASSAIPRDKNAISFGDSLAQKSEHMTRTTIIGIDCATIDAKVGLSIGVAEHDRCVVQFAGVCSTEREVAGEVAAWLAQSTRALIALDAPLGWPQAMGRALAQHRAGEPLSMTANNLFRRATDGFVKMHLGKQSLDVGADRIARTAHAALKLLADLRRLTALPIPMAWAPGYDAHAAAIEVYPAATLIAHGIPARGYKKKDQSAERRVIIKRLTDHVELPPDTSVMERNADALDAVVCVLAGYDFLRGQCHPPEDGQLARHEGWIWVRARTPVG